MSIPEGLQRLHRANPSAFLDKFIKELLQRKKEILNLPNYSIILIDFN
jgi:hypothetical protein